MKKRGRGRPQFEVTDKDRERVRLWALHGVPQDDMALMMKCGINVLRKHFANEIEDGLAQAHSKVRQTLFQMAVSGEYPAMTIFYCKTQLRMREERGDDSLGSIEIRVTGGLPD